VPDPILQKIFKDAGKDRGAIPIHGTVNGQPYKQTLVKYSGHWRLYINTTMLKNSPKRIGETVEVSAHFDPAERTIKPHPKLVKAFKENPKAKKAFDALAPSRQKEIVRYIASLKTAESIDRNIERTIGLFTGKG
jgi:hypothetical protein